MRTTPWTLISTLALKLAFEGGVVKTGTGRLDSWLLGLEPEGPISIAESYWETVCLDAFI